MAIEITAESLKLSVSEASYEPICLRQVNPVAEIKFLLVKDPSTQSNFYFQRKEPCVQVNEIVFGLKPSEPQREDERWAFLLSQPPPFYTINTALEHPVNLPTQRARAILSANAEPHLSLRQKEKMSNTGSVFMYNFHTSFILDYFLHFFFILLFKIFL